MTFPMLTMKGALVFAALAFVANAAPKKTPMDQVVTLLASLKSRAVADGQKEQKSYDKFACWCEDALGRKAADITDEKTTIEDVTNLIIKTKADLASHTAEIGQLKKLIVGNLESSREATEVRNKENREYADDRSESENCVGALEAAIKVLSGAGGKKAGFLETLQEAQLLGVVANIKDVLKTKEVHHHFSDEEISAVMRFAEKPEDYVGARAPGFSAAQVENNPFGDYAPQSSQITGILKGMYDAFTGDLEKDNADEAEKQKAHEALLATKKAELATLEATLEATEMSAATAAKTLADSKESLDDTKETLETDETFFADTKESCQTKASQWSMRTRLRTEELAGMNQAIAIMSSPEAKKTFASATTTFVQLASVNRHDGEVRTKAYGRVKAMATSYKSLNLAKIAVAIKTNGHFDKVMGMIDMMIGELREEDAADIKHRDRCEEKLNANQNAKDDLDSEITKAKAAMARMGNSKEELTANYKKAKAEIEGTKKSMTELLEMRNKDSKNFKQALKDDATAVSLLTQAIAALSKFYADNKIGLLQRAPEYAKDADKAPETSWEGGDYGGKQSEMGGVVAILNMLKEDLVKEMQSGQSDDASAQASYEKDNAALADTLAAQNKNKSDIEGALAEMGAKIEDADEASDNKKSDLESEKSVAKSLGTDCAWVKSTFKTRAEKRKLEIDGLVDAKDFLAGVDAGQAVLPLR